MGKDLVLAWRLKADRFPSEEATDCMLLRLREVSWIWLFTRGTHHPGHGWYVTGKDLHESQNPKEARRRPVSLLMFAPGKHAHWSRHQIHLPIFDVFSRLTRRWLGSGAGKYFSPWAPDLNWMSLPAWGTAPLPDTGDFACPTQREEEWRLCSKSMAIYMRDSTHLGSTSVQYKNLGTGLTSITCNHLSEKTVTPCLSLVLLFEEMKLPRELTATMGSEQLYTARVSPQNTRPPAFYTGNWSSCARSVEHNELIK